MTSRLSGLALLFLAALGLPLPAGAAQALGPQYFDYQVALPPAPASADEAVATLDAREQGVISTLACGSELDYAQDSLAHEAGEDTTARVLAKGRRGLFELHRLQGDGGGQRHPERDLGGVAQR
jgi:hypothetical protein